MSISNRAVSVYFSGRYGELLFWVRVRVRVTVRDSFRFRVRNRMPMFAITPAKLHVAHFIVAGAGKE